jgi:hypothetical protein
MTFSGAAGSDQHRRLIAVVILKYSIRIRKPALSTESGLILPGAVKLRMDLSMYPRKRSL